MSSHQACQICDSPGQGCHFGCTTCKACAAFFRRSIAESLTYRCNNSNNCGLYQNGRIQCRACRLDKCYKMGMRGDNIINASGSTKPRALPTTPVRTSDSITPTMCISPTEHGKSSALLLKMSQFHQNFLASQKSLFKMENLTPANILQVDIPFKRSTIEEFNTMEQANASLIAFLIPLGHMIKKTAQKIKQMNLTDVEIGGIIGAIFYSQLSRTDLWNEERKAEHDELVLNLHSYLLDIHGVSQGGLKLVRLLSLLLDMEKMELQCTNMLILSNFLLDKTKKFAVLEDSFLV